MALLNRFKRRRTVKTKNAATQTNGNLSNLSNSWKTASNGASWAGGVSSGTPSPGPKPSPKNPFGAYNYAAPLTKNPKVRTAAPTRNHIEKLKQLEKAAAHAVQRVTLQLAKVKASRGMARHREHINYTQHNVQRAKQIRAEIKAQLANAQKGRWVERAVEFQAPGKWTYAPKVKSLMWRMTGRFAIRNQLMGAPTLNRYHVRRASKTGTAQAALNKLAAGNVINENQTKLLQGQLTRVQQKQSRQGRQGIFNWEKKLLANAPLVRQMATMYAQPANNMFYNNGMTQANRNMLTHLFGMINTANTKLWQGKALTPNETAALQFRNRLMGR